MNPITFKGQRSKVKLKKRGGREMKVIDRQGLKVKGQKLKIEVQRSKVKGQKLKIEVQRSKVKCQVKKRWGREFKLTILG